AIARKPPDLGGEAIACWNWGNTLVKLDCIAEAITLMEVCVTFEREVGHSDAEKHAAIVEKLRRTFFDESRMNAPGPAPPSQTPSFVGGDDAQFTVYRPRSVVPGRWYSLLAFAHLTKPEIVREVADQARRVLGEEYPSSTVESTRPVPKQSVLTFVP